MFVSSTTGEESAKRVIAISHSRQKAEFPRILNKQIADPVQSAHTPVSARGLQIGNKTPVAPERFFLNTIIVSDYYPPVSNHSIKHPAEGKNLGNIPYPKLDGGQPDLKTPESSGLVPIGTLSKSDPTVSELLIKHPTYGKNCWNILSANINRDKTYTTIPGGSRIYLNPKTLEVAWEGNKTPAEHPVPADPPDFRAEQIPLREPNPFSAGLVKAVKPYMGKPYKEMNCFELVAQGLEGVGIRYYGRDGLGERLVKMATKKGLSSNHYLTGEGLIETSGSPIYSKSVQRIRNSKTEARMVYQEVKPFLHEGMILSFSTPTRGHTGIVSQRGQNWTYINSGHMDHRIEGKTSRGVGEEYLGAEIRNWFRLAAKRKESLQITVGRLDEDKLKALLI